MLNPLVVVAVIIAIAGLCIISAYVQESKGAQKSVTKKVIPLDADLDNTGCGGELVHASGEIHFFTYVVSPDDGGLQITTDIEFHSRSSWYEKWQQISSHKYGYYYTKCQCRWVIGSR